MANKFTSTLKNVKNANKIAAENEQLKIDNKKTADQRNVAIGAAGGITAIGLGATAFIKNRYAKKLAAETEERLLSECKAADYHLSTCEANCRIDDLSIKFGVLSESDKVAQCNKIKYKKARKALDEAKAAYAAYTGNVYVESEEAEEAADVTTKPEEPAPEKKNFLKKLNPFKKKAPTPAPATAPSEEDETETADATETTTETTETSTTETVEATTEASETTETTETSTTEASETTETTETSTTEATEKEVK